MNNFKHIGKDFIPHDVLAKVTGQAKYSEDFRADGMLFCRLLTSPRPHARVKNIDATEALKMEGVLGMLTASDIPAGPPGFAPSLSNEPMYVGEPILAVAALSEQAAEDAIEKIKIDYEPLPFTFDPLESLFPGGKDARGVLIAAISRQRAACVDSCTRPVLPQRVEARKLAPAGRLAGTPRGCFLEQPAGGDSRSAVGEADGLVHSRPARTRCRRRRRRWIGARSRRPSWGRRRPGHGDQRPSS